MTCTSLTLFELVQQDDNFPINMSVMLSPSSARSPGSFCTKVNPLRRPSGIRHSIAILLQAFGLSMNFTY